ncbi:MAG: hypothetical protein V4538_15115 [Bacteroidota bacterium]
MSIVLPNLNRTDVPAINMLNMVNTDIPILLLSRQDEFSLNEEVLSLGGKEFVVCDFIEEGWDKSYPNTLVVGENTDEFDFMQGEGWNKLHEFLAINQPKLYLKRELQSKDQTDKLVPVEYPNWQPDYPLQLKEQFDNRPISAFNYWGRSHEARLMLQSQIWKHAALNGYSVCDNIFQYNDFMHHERESKKLVSFHMPFYSRVEMPIIMAINAVSKLSISLWGCGKKCFRSTGESSNDSICVLPEDELAYSYPFIHNQNCIKFSTNNDITGLKNEWKVMETVDEALRNPRLYDIYLESKKIADWYRIDNYIKNYLTPLINA